MSATVVTLTTDFGETDSYVAQMKGVILSIAPDVHVVDLSHAIAPQAVAAASRFVVEAIPRFPERTVHVCVVDPGVGSARRPMALRWRGQLLVGPDNGLFTPFLGEADAIVTLDRPERWRGADVSSTFHGRDVFAPVGAHLAAGVPLDQVGSPLVAPVRLEAATAVVEAGVVRGEVVHVDHFGNLVSNVSYRMLAELVGHEAPRLTVQIGGETLAGPARSYDAVPPGELVVVVGSSGHVEVSVHRGRADRRLDLEPGARIQVAPAEDAGG